MDISWYRQALKAVGRLDTIKPFEWLKLLDLGAVPVIPDEGTMWCGHRSYADYSNRFPWIVKQLYRRFGFRVSVEIGIAQAGGLRLVHKYAPKGSLVVGIDPLEGTPEKYTVEDPKLNGIFKETNVRLIRKRSQEAVDDLKGLLDGGGYSGVDLLVIDGDHSEEASAFDFINYLPLVNKDGLVWLDDIVAHENSVGRTWQQIKTRRIFAGDAAYLNRTYDYWHWGFGEIQGEKGKFTEAIDGSWLTKLV